MTSTENATGLSAAELNTTGTTLTTAALRSLDSTTTENLALLSNVHAARLARLNRTVAQLQTEQTPNAATLASLKVAIAAETASVARLQLVKTQAAATGPKVNATGWAIWGHVYDAGSKPLSGYTVFLVDASKTYQSTYGYSYTDSQGAFSIVYEGSTSTAKSTAAGVPQVYLSIANGKAQQVFLATASLALAFGRALYVETTLRAGEPALGDLPAEVRKLALPATEAAGS